MSKKEIAGLLAKARRSVNAAERLLRDGDAAKSPSSLERRGSMWWLIMVLLCAGPVSAQAEHLGDLSANPFSPNSLANPFGAGSPFAFKSPVNPFGPYGSPFSSTSATNPFTLQAPRLYDQEGNYRGKLSANPYDPDSISNPFGRYGSPFSPDSVNNPFGAGSPFRFDSPNNPFGSGWTVIGE